MSSVPNIVLPQPQCTLVLTFDGSITHCSPGAATVFGFAPPDLIGKNLVALFPEVEGDVTGDLLRARDGEDARSERLARRADGRALWVDLHAMPVVDPAGTATSLLCVAQDATERRRLAAEVLRQTELEHHLLAVVSHDLKNPLSAITLSAAAALNTTNEPKMVRALDRIRHSASRAVRLIHALLDFNVIRQNGALPVRRRACDLKQVVEEQLDEVLVTRPDREVRVEATGDLEGSWDPDGLAQVVDNLVANALQHTTEDVRVTVRLEGRDRDVVLTVEDRGPGIPPDTLKKLFQPFVRGTQSSTTGRSVGLGLFISRAIVQAHGGTVTCTSEHGKGTAFTVVLPREGRRT
ncbi:MAG: PAS domain-containing sensor histidine kinase [Myxococcaceae bacterium]|nr:PAS domain-containing sensor histidine kinase [Myxococcaceae bacterium]